MLTEFLTVTQDFVTIDLLLWRRFRSEEAGRVERVIALNRGICEFVFLPVGLQVLIELPDVKPLTTRPRVSIWS